MKKLCLFFSAFIPLYILLIVKILVDIIFDNLHFNVLNTLSLILFVGAIIFGSIGAKSALKHKNTSSTKIKIISKKSLTEQSFLGYFSLFVLFALSFQMEKVSMFVVFVLILIMLGVVYIKNDMFYINPFLNILGYNFYEITFVLDGSNEEKTAKFIYFGKLDDLNGKKITKLSHDNFSLIK